MVSRLLHLMVIDILTTAVALRLPASCGRCCRRSWRTCRAKILRAVGVASVFALRSQHRLQRCARCGCQLAAMPRGRLPPLSRRAALAVDRRRSSWPLAMSDVIARSPPRCGRRPPAGAARGSASRRRPRAAHRRLCRARRACGAFLAATRHVVAHLAEPGDQQRCASPPDGCRRRPPSVSSPGPRPEQLQRVADGRHRGEELHRLVDLTSSTSADALAAPADGQRLGLKRWPWHRRRAPSRRAGSSSRWCVRPLPAGRATACAG